MPTIVAHRGVHPPFPENSLEGIVAAWNQWGWAECDVHAAADGTAVVIHDPTLGHTTTGAGAARDSTMSAMRQLRLKDQAAQPTEFSLPTLRQVLDAADGRRRCRLLVEIKPPNDPELIGQVAELLSAARERAACMLQSFDAANLHHARRLYPKLALAFLIDGMPALEESPRVPADFWMLNHYIADAAAIASLGQGRSGRRTRWGAWTVNTVPDLERLLPLRPAMIITDFPSLLSPVR